MTDQPTLAATGFNMPSSARRSCSTPTLGLLPTIALSTAALSSAMAVPAHAQTADSTGLGTLYLESQGLLATENSNDKATASVLDTPQTIQTVTAEEMQERGVTSVEEVLRTTPGVTLQAGEGGNPYGTAPVIRGFDANADITVDGIRNASRTNYETFNLESVQITKGASGSTTGRGGTGGTINLDTKSAQRGNDFLDTGATVGTGSLLRGTLDWNKTLNDRAAVRFNLMRQTADDLNGRVNQTSDRKGAAAALTYALTESTTLSTGLYYYEMHDLPDYGIAFGEDEPIDVDNSTWYGVNDRDFRDVKSESAYVRIDHEFDNALRLSSTLRYTVDTTVYLTTKPNAGYCEVDVGRGEPCPEGSYQTGVVEAQTRSGNRMTETLAFNAQLSGEQQTGALAHSFAVGVDISKENTYGGSVSSSGPDVVLSYDDPYNTQSWDGDVSVGTRSKSGETTVKSLYAFDTITFSPQWEASAGLRYDMFDSTASVGRGASAQEGTEESNFWNGNLGVVYHPRDNISIYANVGSSAEPALNNSGIQTDASSVDALDLEPERSYTYEVGAKWLANPNFLLGGAVYRIVKQNERSTDADGNAVLAADVSISQGVELTFAGQITEKWGVSGGYTYIDYSADGGDTEYSRNVPEHSFSAWTTYDLDDQWSFGAGAFYTGEAKTSDSLTIPSSWQVDMMARYEFVNDFAAQLNVTNLFDKDIYGSSHYGQFVNMGPARTVSLSITKSF